MQRNRRIGNLEWNFGYLEQNGNLEDWVNGKGVTQDEREKGKNEKMKNIEERRSGKLVQNRNMEEQKLQSILQVYLFPNLNVEKIHMP